MAEALASTSHTDPKTPEVDPAPIAAGTASRSSCTNLVSRESRIWRGESTAHPSTLLSGHIVLLPSASTAGLATTLATLEITCRRYG